MYPDPRIGLRYPPCQSSPECWGGYWTRKGAELCLLGKRGSPSPRAKDVAEVVHAPRGRHSEKPEAVYERIERLAAGPYLELFARGTRPGWAAWGNDPALGGAPAGGGA